MAHKRLTLLSLALVFSALALGCGGSTGQTTAVGWTVSSSEDSAIELAHPTDWQVAESAMGKLGLVSSDGCHLLLAMSPSPRPEGLSQTELLDNMLSAAELSCFRDGLQFESTGRRVWLGDSLVWHEIHYRGQPPSSCSGCVGRYSIEMLAFPEASPGRVAASLSCPGTEAPSAEREQLLLDMLNTLTLSIVGSV